MKKLIQAIKDYCGRTFNSHVLELPEEVYVHLKKIGDKYGITPTMVIRRFLTTADILQIAVSDEKAKIFIHNLDGTQEELDMLDFLNKPSNSK